MDLQNQVDEMLRKHRAEIERQLARLDQAIAGDARAGGSALRGRRVEPKYRGQVVPSDDAGNGAAVIRDFDVWSLVRILQPRDPGFYCLFHNF